MFKKLVALIPARGGSKGIYRKNLYPIAGSPLLDYTINAALVVEAINDIYVSSDDPEILKHSEKLGVKTIVRPDCYAADDSSAASVVAHFLDVLSLDVSREELGILYLQPTSPLRTAAHITSAIALAQNGDGVVSVVETEKSPYKSFKLNESGRLTSLFNQHLSNARRQDLPRTYTPNGAIYIFSAANFVSNNGFPSNDSLPFIMEKIESVDVDTLEDIKYLESIIAG